MVWTDLHEARDGTSALAFRCFFDQFSNLEEQHDCNCLWVFTNCECSNSGNHHEKLLIKQLAVKNILDCIQNHVISNQNVRTCEDDKLQPSPRRNCPDGDKKQCRK